MELRAGPGTDGTAGFLFFFWRSSFFRGAWFFSFLWGGGRFWEVKYSDCGVSSSSRGVFLHGLAR